MEYKRAFLATLIKQTDYLALLFTELNWHDNYKSRFWQFVLRMIFFFLS